MAKKRRATAPQAHPTGPLLTVDDAWKKDVRDVMKAKGWNQQDLAEKIPASTGAISNMFKPGDRQIRFKARIEELCEFKLDNRKLEEVLDRVHRKWPKLTLAKAQLVEQLVESLAIKP